MCFFNFFISVSLFLLPFSSYAHHVSPSSSLYLPYSDIATVQHGPSRSTPVSNSQLIAAATLGQQQQQQAATSPSSSSTTAYQQHLSPANRSSIYGSLIVKNAPSGANVGRQQQQLQSTTAANEVAAQRNNFEDNFGLVLNMIGSSGGSGGGDGNVGAPSAISSSSPGGQSASRLSRLRILANASAGGGNVGGDGAQSTMLSAYSFQPPQSASFSSPYFYGGGGGGGGVASGQGNFMGYHHYHHHHPPPPPPSSSCGDRSSLVSSTGLPQAPLEIKWMRCTSDGSPGSPILDVSQAKADDYRLISIERSTALLGIQILKTNKCKGVFVKRVTEGSLAAQAGIQVGDQIIDICGINMRTADYENAAKVLKQCGDPIQMLVQYQYDKFKEIWSSMTEAERCNSLDSVGGGGNACSSSSSAAAAALASAVPPASTSSSAASSSAHPSGKSNHSTLSLVSLLLALTFFRSVIIL